MLTKDFVMSKYFVIFVFSFNNAKKRQITILRKVRKFYANCVICIKSVDGSTYESVLAM